MIGPILKIEEHPDRGHIRPSIEDALQLRLKGDKFLWQIETDWLARIVPAAAAGAKRPNESSAAARDGSSALITMLQNELTIKNQQITQQNDLLRQHAELIGGLNERLHESNVLFATLQKHLSLADGRADKPETIVEASPAAVERNPKPEKGSATPPKSAKARSGFLARLFR